MESLSRCGPKIGGRTAPFTNDHQLSAVTVLKCAIRFLPAGLRRAAASSVAVTESSIYFRKEKTAAAFPRGRLIPHLFKKSPPKGSSGECGPHPARPPKDSTQALCPGWGAPRPGRPCCHRTCGSAAHACSSFRLREQTRWKRVFNLSGVHQFLLSVSSQEGATYNSIADFTLK